MGMIIIPYILLMAGPLAPLIMMPALIPGEFSIKVAESAIEILEFFWYTVPEYFNNLV